MADHSELVAEMVQIDKMTTQERLKLARRRRLQQLKKWSQREKEFNSNKRKKELLAAKKNNVVKKTTSYKVHFVPSVMLLEAASRNDIDEVRRLLMLGVSPDSTNEDGLTALHQCCIDDSEEMLKLLLEFGANVNAKDSEQWTPLHAAATCGHLHIVKYLISKSADLLAVNADGNMPYDICDDDSTLDYIENEMAKRGVTQEMIDGTRAATENQMLAELKSFTSSGNDPDFRDSQGASPVVEELLHKYDDAVSRVKIPGKPSNEDKSLHIAAANGYLTVIEFLLDHHVTIDAQDDDCWQPIHAAACWGHPDAIELLVQSGADLNAKTKNGETPYDISEDVEVRERIMQLKFEMETKKGSQSNRLRRSHSQNTRSQSIRRTSIREKAQISRREAREEARLRQEKVETKLYDSEDELKQHSEANQNGLISSTEVDPQDIDISFLPLGGKDTLQKFKAKTACDILEQVEHVKKTSTFTLRCDNGDVPKDIAKKEAGLCAITDGQSQGDAKNHSKLPSSRTGGNGTVQTSETTSIIQQSPGQSVNVEIHVTVNTSPTYSASNQGTLADLKKQRSTERHRNSISSTSSQDANGKSVPQNGHYVTGACNFNNPPSPTIAPRKYRGDPLEIVGSKKKRGCCNVM